MSRGFTALATTFVVEVERVIRGIWVDDLAAIEAIELIVEGRQCSLALGAGFELEGGQSTDASAISSTEGATPRIFVRTGITTM